MVNTDYNIPKIPDNTLNLVSEIVKNVKNSEPETEKPAKLNTKEKIAKFAASGSATTSVDLFATAHSPNVEKAMGIAKDIIFNTDSKSDIIEKVNDFHKVLDVMGKSELIELSKNMTSLMENSSGNEDIIASLEKGVMDKIKEKRSDNTIFLPLPPSPDDITVPNGITKEELNWALALEQKILNQGYKPTEQETKMYQEITMKLIRGNNPPIPSPPEPVNPVSQKEIEWALALENKVKNGYQPTKKETDKYQDIAQRLATSRNETPPTPAPVKPVSAEELEWADQLQKKFQVGYKPTQTEIEMYTDIYNRYQQTQPVPPVFEPRKIDIIYN